MDAGVPAIAAGDVARVVELVGELARRDVSGLSQDQLMEVHREVARLGRVAGVLGARFAGEVARRSAPQLPGGGLARRQGFGDAGSMVASVTGGSKVGARRAIDAGRALIGEDAPLDGAGAAVLVNGDDASGAGVRQPAAPRYPVVAEACLAGVLSVEAAGLIVAGLDSITDRVSADTLHELERRLVVKAKRLAAHEVRRMVAHAVARADVTGHEQREQRQYAERFLAFREDHTGMVTLTGRLDPVTAAPLRTVIEQMVTHQFRARRTQDPLEADQRTVGQMRADALFDICRHMIGCEDTDRSGVRTTMVVRVGETEAATGEGLGRIDGVTPPVSIKQLRRLSGDAAFMPEVLSGDGVVLNLGRRVRSFTPTQRIALIERDGGCARCFAPPEHCEAHHIRWWEKGGGTDLSNGIMLCTRCHHDIHRYGWDIDIRGTHVNFIPPPQIDPKRQPQPGGLAAIQINDMPLVPDYVSEDFFEVRDETVREWERAAEKLVNT